MTSLQLFAAFLVGALLTYGYTRLRSGQNAEVRALKAKLEVKTTEFRDCRGG